MTRITPVFGRLPQPDERNRNFPIAALFKTGKEMVNRTWALKEPLVLDQSNIGMCVATAFGYELALAPVYVSGITIPKLLNKVYYEAQKIDPFPGGDYPGANPKSSGTSILAGVKTLQALGYYGAYRWAFSAQELAFGISAEGPAVIGINWYAGMMQPDKNRLIRPTGKLLGGHAVCVRGVNFRTQTLLLQNSWGKDWGANGCCLISFKDMERLLNRNGDAVFPVNRNLQLTTF